MFYMKTANVNVRIEESLYNAIRGLGLNISEIVRNALVQEIEEKRMEVIMGELETASKAVKKMGMNSIVKEIRKDRDER